MTTWESLLVKPIKTFSHTHAYIKYIKGTIIIGRIIRQIT